MPIDLSNAWKSGSRIIDSVISLLPNMILAIIIFILFLIVASTARSMVRRITQRSGRRQSLGLLLGQLTYIAMTVFGVLVSISAVAPSFHASNLIGMLGIGSVAIGFAFQNILQNFLAGILLLLQEPFDIGDWIAVTGFEGRVDDIQTRATIITTSERKRIVIPNAVLFTNPVVVGRANANQPETNTAQASAQHT
jgi:small conductance mechanosensitive channel